MRRVIIILAALLLTLALAMPAAAAKPQPQPPSDWDDFYPAVETCDGFTFSYRNAGHLEETYYYDGAGRLVKTLAQVSGTETLINDDTGKSIGGHYEYNVYVTMLSWEPPYTWTRLYSGVFVNIRAPGEGTVLHRAGQFSELVEGGIVLETYKEKGAAKFDDPAVCRALAG